MILNNIYHGDKREIIGFYRNDFGYHFHVKSRETCFIDKRIQLHEWILDPCDIPKAGDDVYVVHNKCIKTAIVDMVGSTAKGTPNIQVYLSDNRMVGIRWGNWVLED